MKPSTIITLTIVTTYSALKSWIKNLFCGASPSFCKIKQCCSYAYFGTLCGLGCRFLMLRCLGPIFFILANFLICSAKIAFILHFLPELSFNRLDLYLLHLSIGIFLFVNIMYNYLLCVFSSPGYPPKLNALKIKSFRLVNGKSVSALPNRIDIAPAVSYRYCKHCDCVKPPRAHHDSISGKCVLHMDHFCPWMSNCVGYNNYRYFYLFLVYLFIACFYVMYITRHSLKLLKANSIVIMGFDRQSLTVLLATIAFAVSISVGMLLGIHTYLIFTNQTTIELYINFEESREAKESGEVFKNPFDKGWRKNLLRVFGEAPWYLTLLPSIQAPVEPEYPVDVTIFIEQNIESFR